MSGIRVRFQSRASPSAKTDKMATSSSAADSTPPLSSLNEGSVHFDETTDSESSSIASTNNTKLQTQTLNFTRRFRNRRLTDNAGSMTSTVVNIARKRRTSTPHDDLAVEPGIEVVDDNSLIGMHSTPEHESFRDSPQKSMDSLSAASINRTSAAHNSDPNNDSSSTSLHSNASKTDLHRLGREEDDEISTPDAAEAVTKSPAYHEPPITPRDEEEKHTEVGSLGEQILHSIPLVQLNEDSRLNRVVRFGRALIDRYRRIPLKKYRLCVFFLLAAITLVTPGFTTGILWGFYFAALLFLYVCVSDPIKFEDIPRNEYEELIEKIQEECIREEHPTQAKIYKGWMNILDDRYNPHTYQIDTVKTVLVRLDGKMLRISRPDRIMLKHGFHCDPTLTESEPRMVAQNIYDLTNATVKLRPRRLARRRWFSRRYPICIKLSSTYNETPGRDTLTSTITDVPEIRGSEELAEENEDNDEEQQQLPPNFKEYPAQREPAAAVRHSNGVEVAQEAEEGYLSDTEESDEGSSHLRHSNSETNVSTSSNSTSILSRFRKGNTARKSLKPSRTIYLFARCAREKERWFHRLRRACYKYAVPKDVGAASMPLTRRFSLPTGLPLDQELSRDYFLYILHSLQFNKHLDRMVNAETSISAERNGVVLMDLGRVRWNVPTERSGKELVLVANLLASRIFYDFCRDKLWCSAVQNKIQTKLASIHLPYFIDTLELSSFNIGTAIPHIEQIYKPVVDEWGIWVDFDIRYEGLIKLALETRVNLMRIKEQHDSTDCASSSVLNSLSGLRPISHYSDEEVPESPEISPDEDYGSKMKQNEGTKEKKTTGKKVLHLIDKFTSSNFFSSASELKPIRKLMEEISSTRLMLNVEVTELEGTMTVNMAAPPSDRLWYAFRQPPQMSIKAVPQIGDRTVVFSTLSDWIEKKMTQLLEKNLVVPNMDDLIVKVLSGNDLLQGPLNQ